MAEDPDNTNWIERLSEVYGEIAFKKIDSDREQESDRFLELNEESERLKSEKIDGIYTDLYDLLGDKFTQEKYSALLNSLDEEIDYHKKGEGSLRCLYLLENKNLI